MRQYGTKLLRLVYFFVRDRDLAEDITQEVFVKVYRHLPHFRGESSIHTWVYRIAVNECKGYLRSWAFRKIVPMDVIESRSGASVEAEALNKLDRDDVTRLVMALPFRHRQVIVLHYYGELSIAETAAVLGLTEGAVRTRLHRARQQLKKMMMEEGLGWI
ncbi:MAG: sigma-70 family RNA polymerase sigma factor [Brevibacillus sp.]|nr:sigma-70 family RNA polymerase sigma factor [Brevibacillus sp.]